MTIEEVIKIVKNKFPNMKIYNKYYIYDNKFILAIGDYNDNLANTEIYVSEDGNIGFFNKYSCLDNIDNFKKAVDSLKIIDSALLERTSK